MSTVNESISRISELLDHPREQRPTARAVFGSIRREFQNFYNELANAGENWAVTEQTVTLSAAGDTALPNETGRILLVTAGDCARPLEFADLRDAGADWWLSCPIVSDRPEDDNFAAVRAPVAVYAKNGAVYLRSRGLSGIVTVTAQTGDWAKNITLESSAVLSQYHHLPEIRAAMNLTHAARWSDDANADTVRGDRILNNLLMQERRVYEQFRIAKRSMVQERSAFIGTHDGYF